MKEVGPRLRRESVDRNNLKSKTCMHLREEERDRKKRNSKSLSPAFSRQRFIIRVQTHLAKSYQKLATAGTRRTDLQMVKGDNKFRGAARRE